MTSAYPQHLSDPRGIFVHRLAKALVEKGETVRVIAPHTPPSLRRELRDGVEVLRVRYWPGRGRRVASGLGGIMPNIRAKPSLLAQIPPLVAALGMQARRHARSFDVVHAHWLFPAGLAATGLGRPRRPLVVTSHGGDLNLGDRSKAVDRVSAFVARRADACIGVSERLVERFRSLGVDAGRTFFIPLGIETGKEAGISPKDGPTRAFRDADRLRVLFVGSLIPRKSVATLLEALARLERRGHASTAAIVGEGPERAELLRLRRALGLEGTTTLVGNVPPAEIRDWMEAADVLVLPSLSEGRPTVIMEAMGSGLPTVATDVPGTRELVRAGETGMLVEPGNPGALADALERLARDEELRDRMGQAGRRRIVALGLSAAEAARRHQDLYRELVARVGREKLDDA